MVNKAKILILNNYYTVLYGAETQTLGRHQENTLVATEMDFWRITARIKLGN